MGTGARACTEPAATVPNTTIVVAILGTHIVVNATGPGMIVILAGIYRQRSKSMNRKEWRQLSQLNLNPAN